VTVDHRRIGEAAHVAGHVEQHQRRPFQALAVERAAEADVAGAVLKGQRRRPPTSSKANVLPAGRSSTSCHSRTSARSNSSVAVSTPMLLSMTVTLAV